MDQQYFESDFKWRRYEKLERFLNVAGKSGYVDIKAIVQEMADLLDISKAYVKDYRVVPVGA